MCCCGKPTINGEPGYSWDGKSFSTRPVHPPELAEGDELLCDEPGRCGGLDCHSHHFRLVKNRYGYNILVQHGGGAERISLGVIGKYAIPSFDYLDSNQRYWLLHTLYSVHQSATDQTRQQQSLFWRVAAAEKRIKTRKTRAGTKVWIEDKKENAQ